MQQLGELLGDGQPQSGTAVLAGLEGIDLGKGLEDVVQRFGRDAEPGVLYFYADPNTFLFGDGWGSFSIDKA